MTREELIADIWASLPATKHAAGRRRVERIIGRTIKSWPVAVLVQCDSEQTAVVGKYLARSIQRQEKAEYGMGFFTAIIVSALISEIIKRLVQRWSENRAAMLEAVQ